MKRTVTMAADAGAFRIDTDGDDVTLWFQPNGDEEPTVLTMRASALRVALASVGLNQPPVMTAGGRGSAGFVGVGAGRGGSSGTASVAFGGFPGGGGGARTARGSVGPTDSGA